MSCSNISLLPSCGESILTVTDLDSPREPRPYASPLYGGRERETIGGERVGVRREGGKERERRGEGGLKRGGREG